jgi:hypothetical protein
LGKSVALNFFVVQSVLDSSLLKLFPLILVFPSSDDEGRQTGCGSYSDNNRGNTGTFSVWGHKDIIQHVIPFFEKYTVLGVKYLDFEDFKKVSFLVKNKAHLTKEGLEEISLIKSGMNRNR